MNQTSLFKCDCGKLLEVAHGLDTVKCFACGKSWHGEMIQAKQSEVRKIAKQIQKPTIAYSNEEILKIKEASTTEESASAKSDEPERPKKKVVQQQTIAYSNEEILKIKEASLGNTVFPDKKTVKYDESEVAKIKEVSKQNQNQQ